MRASTRYARRLVVDNAGAAARIRPDRSIPCIIRAHAGLIVPLADTSYSGTLTIGGGVRGYNFTEDVRRVLAIAREEAGRLHHEYVGTEHILLGFTTPENAAHAQILRRGGAEPGEVRLTIESILQRGNSNTERR